MSQYRHRWLAIALPVFLVMLLGASMVGAQDEPTPRTDSAAAAFAGQLGDVLAAYVELGHGVVALNGAMQTGTALGGDFVEKGYLPITSGIRSVTTPLRFVSQDPGDQWLVGPIRGHESVYGVNVLFAGEGASPNVTRAIGVTVRPGSNVTAVWDDAVPAIIVREPRKKNRIRFMRDAGAPQRRPRLKLPPDGCLPRPRRSSSAFGPGAAPPGSPPAPRQIPGLPPADTP